MLPGLNRAIKAAIEAEAYGKAGGGAKPGAALDSDGLAEGYWRDEAVRCGPRRS